MKTILLCRVSTKDQEITGYSLDAQEKMLTQFARTKSYTIERVFRVAESASKSQVRKIFQEMLSFIEKNRVETICCEKTDRLLRNGKDAVRIDEWLAAKESRAVHFVKENFTLTKNTPAHERFIWDVKVAAASYYTNNLSEEVRKGQKEKLAQGWLPQRPPIGYKTTGEKGHKIQVIDEKKGHLVQQAFELYATGNFSLSSITEKMYDLGLRNTKGNKVTRSKMHGILKNSYYIGKIPWHGQVFTGVHQPLINKGLFATVQNKLARKTKQPRYRKHLPTFRGKIFCEECGGTVTWEQQKGHWYGHCNGYRTCSHRKYWRQETIEEMLSPYFDKICPFNDNVLRIIEAYCKLACEAEYETRDKTLSTIQESIEKIQNRLDAIYEDKIDGKITPEFYEKKKHQYEIELAEAERKLPSSDEGHQLKPELVFSLFSLASSAKEAYFSPKTTVLEQRLLLSTIFSNFELNTENIRPKYTEAYEFVAEWVPIFNNHFRTEENYNLTRPNGGINPNCPLLRAFRDKFVTQLLEITMHPAELTDSIKQLLSLATCTITKYSSNPP